MQINNTTNVCSSFLVNSLKRVHVAVSVLSVLFPCLSSWFCFLYASIALFCCFCMSFLYFSLTLLYSSQTHWLAHCYYLYFSKCPSPPFLSLSRLPPFTLSTLSEGAIQINASALKVTTCIQLQGLFLSESHLRPCLLPHQGANHHLISALHHVFARAKNILNTSIQTWMLGQCIARMESPCKYLMWFCGGFKEDVGFRHVMLLCWCRPRLLK